MPPGGAAAQTPFWRCMSFLALHVTPLALHVAQWRCGTRNMQCQKAISALLALRGNANDLSYDVCVLLIVFLYLTHESFVINVNLTGFRYSFFMGFVWCRGVLQCFPNLWFSSGSALLCFPMVFDRFADVFYEFRGTLEGCFWEYF